MILGMFSDDIAMAKKEYERYMNEETIDSFLGLQEDKEMIDEERARALLADMLLKRGIRLETGKDELFNRLFLSRSVYYMPACQ